MSAYRTSTQRIQALALLKRAEDDAVRRVLRGGHHRHHGEPHGARRRESRRLAAELHGARFADAAMIASAWLAVGRSGTPVARSRPFDNAYGARR